MDKQLLLSRLQKLTGTLRATGAADLKTLNRKLAEEFIRNPELNISGTQLQHEDVQPESATDFTTPLNHIEDLLEGKTVSTPTPDAPLIFRRETAYLNNLMGNSVPSWGVGLQATESLGPFIDEHGISIWFDFFHPTRMVKVFIQGQSQPVLLIPVWGTLTVRSSYRIEAGSVWIASNLIARTSLLNGYYTGLKITGGTLNLAVNAVINGENIVISPFNTGTLQLELRQNTVTGASADAGFDATAAVIELPKSFSLQFNAVNSTVNAADASCMVFGNDCRLHFKNTAPQWIDFLSHILITYSATSNSDSPDIFQINSSGSKLCTLTGSAKIDINSGWLLPAAKIDASQLGEASGIGSVCVGLQMGLSATWKGLKGGATKLNHPAVISEPGMLTVIDFFAENIYARQKWVLWQNSGAKHHSDITIGFGKLFPFFFVSASKGTEQVTCFCNYKAAFDKPVDANGNPFKIQSSIALAGIVQTGNAFRVFLFDNDLLFDGKINNPEIYKRYSIVLRNALFNVSPPYSLFFSGDLQDENKVIKGTVALMFAIRIYLPTLPDPYVASYTAYLRDPASLQSGLGQLALGAFVKWPNPAEVIDPADSSNDPAYLYFRFAPLNLPKPPANIPAANNDAQVQPITKNFQTGVGTFNQNLVTRISIDSNALPLISKDRSDITGIAAPVVATPASGKYNPPESEITGVINDLKAHPLLNYLKDKDLHISTVVRAAIQNGEQSDSNFFAASFTNNDNASLMATTGNNRGLSFGDKFMLLDVSSNADQMGVSFGAAIKVERSDNDQVFLRSSDTNLNTASPYGGQALPLQILNMDVVATGLNVRAVTLPQISWEPVFNIPLPIEGPITPTALAEIKKDLITYTPGLVVYENDGIPTHIYSESPYQVPITPLSVTHHFLKEYNDKKIPRQLHSTFTLPFALLAQAHFNRSIKLSEDKNAALHFHMPWFDTKRGGLQIKAEAPPAASPNKSHMFKGQTVQVEDNLRWFLLGYPLTGSTLGNQVKKIFNQVFNKTSGGVPLERIEISGYGASIFSNWLDKAAAIAAVSQAKFDVIVGRTGHEVIQVRSVMYMCTGIVHVVRTITLMRSPSGYVFRSDSGWKAESNAFYDCNYFIDFSGDLLPVNDPYEFHPGPVLGVSNVREIKDYPAGGTFTSSFSLNESGLPNKLSKILPTDWNFIKDPINLGEQLPVILQAVVFDADVHMNDVTSGGVKDNVLGGYRIQSRKRLGYVQLSPTGILITPKVYAQLLTFQNGALGGPVDSTINIAGSEQKMRVARVDINPALNGAGQPVFVSAARGSLILPKDGSWSMVKQNTDTGDVKPVEEGQMVPLIRTNGALNFKIAHPADIINTNASKINFGVLQSTGTQKLLFDIPQFANGVKKLLSNETYFADAYKLLNSKGVFPNIANALQLTNAEKEVAILGEGIMKMADRVLHMNTLLSNFQYPFIDEPKVLKVYAEYQSKNGTGNLTLGIDSAAAVADKWKAALSNIRVVVDLGPFPELMWVNGNFQAANGVKPMYDKPNLEFGKVLQPVVDILRVLETLSGGEHDKGMDVGMSNAPDNWEYKFNCSKEIPVIQFPSPLQLTINPNPPLKLEAGLRIGFYFNEKISVPTDLKQLVPACGAYVEFFGRLQVQCFTLGVASIYAVGQATLGIAADSKAGVTLYMKVGFGVEIVVGLPVVANVSVLYMVEVEVSINADKLHVGAMMMFRGSVEICGGLVAICIQIEAGGAIDRDGDTTSCVAQVTFSIDVCVLWVIDINFSDSWQESRQIA